MNRLSAFLVAPLLCLLFCSTILAQPDSDADDSPDDRPEADADRKSPDETKLKEQVITATRTKTRKKLTGGCRTVREPPEKTQATTAPGTAWAM